MGVQVLIASKPLGPPFIVKVPGFTEEQFDAISTEDTPYELLDGVLIMHSPATFEHEDLQSFLMTVLRGYVAELDLGHVVGSRAVLHLSPGRKVEPDLLFLLKGRRPVRGHKEIQGTADLVVEILSPSTRSYDLGEKRRAYREARTPELWFIDQDREQLIQDRLVHDRYRTRIVRRGRVESVSIPGLWLELSWLWRQILPRPLECLRSILAESTDPSR